MIVFLAVMLVVVVVVILLLYWIRWSLSLCFSWFWW